MTTRERYDVALIGAGIAGASAAYFLARQGAHILLLEKEARPGLHSTGRSAALFVQDYGNDHVRQLTQASRPFFDRPPEGFAETPLLAPRGILTIAPEEDLGALAEEAARRPPGRAVMLNAAEVRGQHPVLREAFVAAALYDPAACDIDVDALHQGYLRGARARGASIYTSGTVTALEHRRGGWEIETETGSFAAAKVVNAAGAWADDIAIAAGRQPLGLQPLRRTAALFDPPPLMEISAWPFVVDIRETFYFKPDAGKILASPADTTPVEPGDVYPEEWDIAVAIDRVQRAAELDVRRVTHSWAGLRTFAPDETPVIGYDAQVPDFFWLAGQGGFGLQTSPAAGALAAHVILEERPEPWADHPAFLAALSPARFFDASAAVALK